MPINNRPPQNEPTSADEQLSQDEYWMKEALKLAKQAGEEEEVPIGAVLIWKGNCIGRGWNQPIRAQDPTAHAEIMALREGAKTLKNYRLLDTTLYVTLEPCAMCAGAMIHARVKRLVFGASDPKMGTAGSVMNLLQERSLNHRITCTSGVLRETCSEMLKSFFLKKRG